MTKDLSPDHAGDSDDMLLMASLTLSLRADSGYECEQTCRINVDQWARISAILNEPEQNHAKR